MYVSRVLLFASGSAFLAEIRIDSLTEKKQENLIYLACMAKNKEREVWDVIEENNEYYDKATLVEDVDSESGS